jgi:hypothetical protein
MNSDFLRWLLNVREIPKGSDGLHLAWERPWPTWVWVILLAAAGLVAFWSYSRLVGWRPGRTILASMRFFMIVLALLLISGPMLELPRETIEQDWVMMVVDRSASMTIKDVQAQSQTPVNRISRDQQLRDAIARQSSVFNALSEQRHVVWMGFHSGAFNLSDASPPSSTADPFARGGAERGATPLASVPDFGSPDGRRSNLEGALEQALQRAAARPVSGIVVFSDGRADAPPSRGLVRRLQSDAIPVFVVPLGSAEPLGDVAVRRVEAPRRAFVRDKVPVLIELDRLGAGASAGSLNAQPATVKLVDESTGEVLDQLQLPPGDATDKITLTAQPSMAGDATWKVVVQTPQPDLIPENNLKPFQIELIDRPLRVLYVEGYPRWEYRYVKNLLVREKSIESSVMLISADRDFAQEGNQPITRLPRSPEEFAAFDVIVLGDVPGTFFSPDQLDMIRDHIADRGAGLLWIAGERYLPSSYAGTSLADLLPMRGSLNVPAIGEPVTIVPTPLAQRLGVLQLTLGNEIGWPAQLADPSTGWSRLFYVQRIEPGQLKPTAEVLAETANPSGGSAFPVVLNMRYGAGQSLYVATDEIWRWRYGRGELLHEQFWVQIIRMLGRESLASTGEPATLEVNPRRVATNQPMRIELRILDSQLLDPQRATVRVVLESVDGNRVAELELRRVEGQTTSHSGSAAAGNGENLYAATFLPDSAGELRLRVDDPTLARANVRASVDVFAPDDELRRPETDHELLKNLAAATGGLVLRSDELDQLSALPNRAVKTLNPLTEPIWDSPLAFALALLALTFEWVGRKVLRLV